MEEPFENVQTVLRYEPSYLSGRHFQGKIHLEGGDGVDGVLNSFVTTSRGINTTNVAPSSSNVPFHSIPIVSSRIEVVDGC